MTDKDAINQIEKGSSGLESHVNQLDETITLEIRVKDMLPDDCLPSENNPNVTLVKLEMKNENEQPMEEDGIIQLKNEESQVAGDESVAEDAGQERREEAGSDTDMQNEAEGKEKQNAE